MANRPMRDRAGTHPGDRRWARRPFRAHPHSVDSGAGGRDASETAAVGAHGREAVTAPAVRRGAFADRADGGQEGAAGRASGSTAGQIDIA